MRRKGDKLRKVASKTKSGKRNKSSKPKGGKSKKNCPTGGLARNKQTKQKMGTRRGANVVENKNMQWRTGMTSVTNCGWDENGGG